MDRLLTSIDAAAGNSAGFIDPVSNSLAANVDVGSTPTGVAVGEDAVWVTNASDGTVTRIDPATRTFTAIDCAGLARVDFFVTPELDVYLNEINTMPGFTATSMFPRMWAASGLDYPKLVSRLLRTAMRRGTGLH